MASTLVSTELVCWITLFSSKSVQMAYSIRPLSSSIASCAASWVLAHTRASTCTVTVVVNCGLPRITDSFRSVTTRTRITGSLSGAVGQMPGDLIVAVLIWARRAATTSKRSSRRIQM